MIKFTNFSLKIWSIASYYLRFPPQFGKFSLFFLSPYSYAKVSLFILMFISTCVFSDGYERLLYLKNFQKLGERACKENKVMVIMVSRETCPYCVKLKKLVFVPEVKHGELNSKWLLRELLIDGGETHIGFDGKKIQSVKYAQSIKATLTPTVLFLDKKGQEIGKRIIGTGGAIDFYDFYLKRSINEALANQNCSS